MQAKVVFKMNHEFLAIEKKKDAYACKHLPDGFPFFGIKSSAEIVLMKPQNMQEYGMSSAGFLNQLNKIR